MVSIRGAITVEEDLEHEIFENTTALLNEIIKSNNLFLHKITAIFFSCTRDLTSAYPAEAARYIGIRDASLMCLQEMYVVGSLEKCIRICLFYDANIEQASIKHIYRKNAVTLRPDWVCASDDCIS